MTTVSIKNLSKAKVLSALFGAASPSRLGCEHLTEADAKELLDSGEMYFDYVNGRILKIDLSNDDELETAKYNRDNGFDSAENVIAILSSDKL